MIITKDFIRDIKQARSMVLRFNGERSTIDIFQDGDNDRVTTYRFDGSFFGYTGNWHTSIYFDASSNILNTFIKSLRPGDKLKFYALNYVTESLLDHGFSSYNLNAQITRYKKDGVTISSMNDYFIDSQTCLSNSSAINLRPDNTSKENNVYCLNK